MFSSVGDADKAPEAVAHFKSKFDIENHLKASGLDYSILRPVAFFENFDDPVNFNALTPGSIKGLWPASLSVLCVATADIGKAGCVMLSDPATWKGKTLDCSTEHVDGAKLSAALTQASGIECTYSLSMPPFAIKLFLNDLHHMIKFFTDPGYSCSRIQESGAMGIDAWLEREVGQQRGAVQAFGKRSSPSTTAAWKLQESVPAWGCAGCWRFFLHVIAPFLL